MGATLFHWASCSDCRRVRAQLAEAGVDAVARDFFARPLSRDEVEGLAQRAGAVSNVFSYRSPSFRALRIEAPEDLPDERLINLILEDPRRLRRPILVTEEAVLVGARQILRSVGAPGRDV